MSAIEEMADELFAAAREIAYRELPTEVVEFLSEDDDIRKIFESGLRIGTAVGLDYAKEQPCIPAD